MKKVAILLLFMSHFGFSQIIVPDTSKMSDTAKMMWYVEEKKSPIWGLCYYFLLPTAGHAYAGDWKRGIKFKSGELGALIIGTVTVLAGLGEFDSEDDFMFALFIDFVI